MQIRNKEHILCSLGTSNSGAAPADSDQGEVLLSQTAELSAKQLFGQTGVFSPRPLSSRHDPCSCRLSCTIFLLRHSQFTTFCNQLPYFLEMRNFWMIPSLGTSSKYLISETSDMGKTFNSRFSMLKEHGLEESVVHLREDNCV